MKTIVSLVVLAWATSAYSQVGLSYQVQAPQIATPTRGSLVGQFANLEFGPGDVDRGGFSLPSPYQGPTERGPAPSGIFPTYSPEAGISEFGMGWQNQLALVRYRTFGHLDYATDDLTGPFGHCQKGLDGDWYPVGMRSPVRIRELPDGFAALMPDGSTWRFGQSAQVQNPRGTYAWNLTEVETAIGQKAVLTYEANSSGRLFLTQVDYGGRGDDFQYRIVIAYESLQRGFVDYRSSFPIQLDRRASEVSVFAKNSSTGEFALRWRYQPTYLQDTLGPAFYLSSVQQVFASGESPPIIHFEYSLASATLPNTEIRRATKFDPVVRDFGGGVALPDSSASLDDRLDGLPDLERAYDYSLIRQTPDGYVYESLPPRTERTRLECRGPDSFSNRPRNLALVRATDNEYAVVSPVFRQPTADTLVVVCNRAGEALHEQVLPGDWTLSRDVRLVDLNGDNQADLIRVYYNGYQVIPNVSTPSGYAFGTPISGTLNLGFPFQGFWIHDFNGDSLPDIVIRSGSYLVVYFGRGSFQFDAEPRWYSVENQSGQQIDVSNYQFTFLDANNDGLSDLVLSISSGAYLFVNDGSRLVNLPVPALEHATDINFPMFQDLVGSGNAELFLFRQGLAYSSALTQPGTGLISSMDDGRGTVFRFQYAKGPPSPGTRHRHSLLDVLTAESSGREPISYRYIYSSPTLHSRGRFLIGYDHVTREAGPSSQRMDFLNDDNSASLLLSAVVDDANDPEAITFTTKEYQTVSYQGLPWNRPTAEEHGFRSVDGRNSVAERTEYQDYQADVCPRTIWQNNGHGTLLTQKTRANPTALVEHLHCLDGDVVTTGTHPDATLNFTYEVRLTRNAVGLVERVESIAGAESLTLQQTVYNPDFTVQSISAPGRGTSFFDYQPGTRLLRRVTPPDLVVTTVMERDPVTDATLTMDTNRGDLAYQGYFRYDGQERLSKSWNSLGTATEDQPNQWFDYRYAAARRPASVHTSTLVDGQLSIFKEGIDFSTAAGEAFTAARRIPEGWVLEPVVRSEPALARTSTFKAVNIDQQTDVFTVDYDRFFQGAQQISSSIASAFGGETDIRTKFHSDVEQHVTVNLGWTQGRLTRTSLENGVFPTVEILDAGKRVVEYQDPGLALYRYAYDASGRIRELTLPDGTGHRISFDPHGRVQSIQRDGIATVEYEYEAITGLVHFKRFRAPTGDLFRLVEIHYDGIGRKTSETHTDVRTGATSTYRFFYDGATPENPTVQNHRGLLTATSGETSDSGQTYEKLFQHRADALLTGRVVTLPGWRTVTSSFLYLEDNSLSEKTTTVTDGVGQPLSSTTQHYTRDGWGRNAALLLNGQSLANLSYDANGLLQMAHFTAGETSSFTFDGLTRRIDGLTQVGLSFTGQWSQQFNDRGFVALERIAAGVVDLSRGYTYRPAGFLNRSADAQNSYIYEFDSFGLPTAIEENGSRREFSQQGDVLTVGGVSYRFDSLGRTVQRTDLGLADDLALTYGPDGQVSRAQRGTSVWTFVYDEDGRRLAKLQQGAFLAGYFEEGYLDANSLTEPEFLVDRLVGVLQSGRFQLLAVDGRGTLEADSSGTARIASPFGNRLVHPDLAAAIDYVQKAFDADLGTVRMGVRDYDPRINRFWSPDPYYLEKLDECVQATVSCNLYSYARNNPLNFRDRTGQYDELIHGALTYHLALAAGFTAEQAARLALGTAKTDHDLLTSPTNPVNMATGITTFFHFNKYAEAILELRMKMPGGLDDLASVGQYNLHGVEDYSFNGPHSRGDPFYLFGLRQGHGFFKNEDGSLSRPWSKNADHAFRNPNANSEQLIKVYGLLERMAAIKNENGVSYPEEAVKIIQQAVHLKTVEGMKDFLNQPGLNGAPPYLQMLQDKRYFDITGGGWPPDIPKSNDELK
jgi:RHS repeat-associated protein